MTTSREEFKKKKEWNESSTLLKGAIPKFVEFDHKNKVRT